MNNMHFLSLGDLGCRTRYDPTIFDHVWLRNSCATGPSKYQVEGHAVARRRTGLTNKKTSLFVQRKCSDYTSSPQGQRSSDESIPTCNDDVHCSLSKGAL